MAKKLFSILAIVFFGLWIFTTAICGNLQAKNDQDSISNAQVGGRTDHMYHLKGTILQNDVNTKTIIVQVDESENDTLQGNEFILDCSKFNLHTSSLAEGETVTFYFFLGDIEGEKIKVSDLTE